MEKLILHVEDNPDDVLLMNIAFRKAKVRARFDVLTDGQQAIEYFTASADKPVPTLMLLDLKLPRRSGLEVLSWVRNQPELKGLLVIMLSSSNQAEDVARAYELGVNSYLVKPGNPDEMLGLARTIDTYWLKLNARPGEAAWAVETLKVEELKGTAQPSTPQLLNSSTPKSLNSQ